MTADDLLRRAIAAQRAGDMPVAARLYEQVLAVQPNNVQVLHALGIVRTQMKDFAKAVACLKQCVALDPRSADVRNSLGMALFPNGDKEGAIASFEAALAVNPKHARAANNLGNLYLQSKDLDAARDAFRRALDIKPDYVEARTNLGHCLLISSDNEDALGTFEAALAVNAAFAPAIEGAARALSALERYDEAVERRRQLLARDVQDPVAHVELGLALKAADRHADAIACFGRAAAIDPGYAAAHANAGIAQLELGRLDDARHSFETACRTDPSVFRYRHLLATAGKVERDNGIVAALEGALRAESTLPDEDRIHLHFALAKALADTGDAARSFEHVREGNRLQRGGLTYDEAATLSQNTRMSELFTQEFAGRLEGAGDPTPAPVFIVGMPRTGSTLVEQILAAHPDVFAVGESAALRDIVQGLSKRKRAPFPEWLPLLTRGDIAEIAEKYLARTRRVATTRKPSLRFDDRLRIVDKMPGNYLFLGLIQLALPNARIIHTRRDPIETCLSCFRIYFQHLQYASDLAELGRFYRHYERLMQHWHEVLRKGIVLDVDYEGLVDDFENGARRIVSHCGLEWTDACLSFGTAARPVRTASVVQVRQPLNRGSLASWHPSEDVLAPLREALAG